MVRTMAARNGDRVAVGHPHDAHADDALPALAPPNAVRIRTSTAKTALTVHCSSGRKSNSATSRLITESRMNASSRGPKVATDPGPDWGRPSR